MVPKSHIRSRLRELEELKAAAVQNALLGGSNDTRDVEAEYDFRIDEVMSMLKY